ncbi:hypothetical protein [Shewanella youngdeokensis]|uniref:Uncharacterized protein n=1 Tax=Shewanella youngdeokensis TaxID=2999068 RepID=A0ABZ0JZE5_9GAMM|nr:hypothetical protein RGE70_02265 [Shewanella sp. DAU334]
MTKFMLATLLLFAAGCSSDNAEPAKVVMDATPPNVTASATLPPAQMSRVKPIVTIEDGPTRGKIYSYQLNQQKFVSNSAPLVKGSLVTNSYMSSSGVLKGSFVVVSSAQVESLSTDYHIEKIAEDTFRLVPITANANLYSLYTALLKSQALSLVEIEIDYSAPLASQIK